MLLFAISETSPDIICYIRYVAGRYLFYQMRLQTVLFVFTYAAQIQYIQQTQFAVNNFSVVCT